jgi:hypothetical protein
MVARKMTRRAVLQHGTQVSLGGWTLLWLGACGESDDRQFACNQPGQLSNSEMSMRTSLGYADVSPNSAEVCGGCEYFTAESSGGGCGSCELLPGRVNRGGRCDSWSAKS